MVHSHLNFRHLICFPKLDRFFYGEGVGEEEENSGGQKTEDQGGGRGDPPPLRFSSFPPPLLPPLYTPATQANGENVASWKNEGLNIGSFLKEL